MCVLVWIFQTDETQPFPCIYGRHISPWNIIHINDISHGFFLSELKVFCLIIRIQVNL